ncbi:MAG: hypothetical protein V1787_02780, partial [Candidatus Micrarchaeota archaeon]
MRRGIAFTLDASFAIVVVLAAVPLIMIMSVRPVPSQLTNEQLHMQAEDAIDVLAKARVAEVRNEPAVAALFASGALTAEDENHTLMDVLGGFWATGGAGNLSAAGNLSTVLAPYMPANMNWRFSITNDTLYNTSDIGPGAVAAAVSKRAASGFNKDQPSTGYVARAFL